MPESTTDYIVNSDGAISTPPGSPKILIHTRHGRVVGIYCNHPAKIIEVETRENPKRANANTAFRSLICPQTSVKVVGGYSTSVDHMLAMTFDDPSMDDDLRAALVAHEIILDDEWADVE